jgi:hypothetical protein
LGFNSPPLSAVKTGGAGDLFPRMRKDSKEKSSIPRQSWRGFFITPAKVKLFESPGKAGRLSRYLLKKVKVSEQLYSIQRQEFTTISFQGTVL